jgi:hypothetical protein
MDKIKALIKRIKSYTKKSWIFEDYPTKTWKNQNAGEDKVAYGAGIINWSLMVGHGNTPEKALTVLKDNFKNYRANNNNLPRPGTKVPIKFASTDNIDNYEKTAVGFFRDVLDMDYYEGFYSDGSILAYFEPYDNNEAAKKLKEEIIKKTLSLYNVDISDIYDEPLWIILEKIEKYRRQ